ncbi:MAG: glycosyltransferase [Acidobacteriota bacterium]
MTIERILHQTWKTGEIPERFRPWVESVRRENPDFDYRLWTDADNLRLIEEHYPWFLETYLAYRHPVERADAARYFIVYTHGGLYLDLDMECLQPLSPLLEDDAVHLALEAGPRIEQQVISNALLGAPRHHPFFERVIRALPAARQRDVTFQDIFDNTGPNLFSKLWAENRRRYAFRILGLDLVCPVKVVPQNSSLPSSDLDVLREQRALALLHHNTETWNLQLPAPVDVPAGWVLFEGHDLPGQDLAFVGAEAANGEALIRSAEQVEGAIAVNYNGLAKAAGDGSLVATEGRDFWLKEGIRPWVAVRQEVAAELAPSRERTPFPPPRRSVQGRSPDRPEVRLISYANRMYQPAREHCLETGREVGGFSRVQAVGPADLDGDFVRRNLQLIGQKRGAGLWLWKPYILLQALEEVEDGGWLFYADAGTEFLRPIDPIVDAARALETDLLFLGEGFRESQYTKRDAFVLLDCDQAETANSPQRFASHLLLRNSTPLRELLGEVLEAAQDPRILSDLPNTMGRPNYPDFVAHRHDQSILSLLSKKRGIVAPPTNTWVTLGHAEDRGQILNHHRRPVPAGMPPAS